ncbi:hypothetical protein CBM2587_B90593 [Cupriavidus taiwanensis]|uniref:Uncharacterized protein n=1 Tax=Cupriavidus taiwanensis TaxID=164546 RepID=A0A975XFJ1_9BURK|nr:hypothetical protein CBM2587_B90593 [Cupriavidus taiwanensis]
MDNSRRIFPIQLSAPKTSNSDRHL